MLSIDEAIEHAREVAEEQRELFRLCPYPSQECNGADICKCLKNKHDGCIKCAKEHEQLAEWLEELKAYRAIGTVEECKNSVLDIQKAYNKAIDDFVNLAKEHDFKHDKKDITNCVIGFIEFFAEQLKAGGKNVQKK